MGCACKTGQQIRYLQDKYGVGRKDNQENKGMTPKILAVGTVTVLIQILLIPFFFFYIIYKGVIRRKPISIAKMFNVGHK